MTTVPGFDGVARALADLLQLERSAREARTSGKLGFIMVNDSLRVLGYRQAALWLDAGMGRLTASVVAVSGVPQPNPSAPYHQWIERLCKVVGRTSPDTQGAAGACDVRLIDRDALPDFAQEWAEWLPGLAYWLPLAATGEPPFGGLLMATDVPWESHELAVATELASCYGHALAALAPRPGVMRAWRAQLFAGPRRWWWWAAAALVLAVPVPQNVLAPAEVVPRDPFLVRAPQDGVIDRILVSPNQPVQPGTPLLTLDASAFQTRDALARQALSTAREEYRQSAQLAVTDDKSKLDMAMRRGAVEEKDAEAAYSAQMLSRVQVVAERAGVAVFADAQEWQGKAVATGERVLTLADPAQVELNIFVPAGERFDVSPGAEVTLYPNSDPLAAYEGHVSFVAYSAEPARDGQLAYQLKARFEGPLPRIGTMGTAKLHGDRVPLLLHALRRPLTVARQWLGW